MPKRDNNQAARALAEWAMQQFKTQHDASIAEKYGITTRTLWNWKDALRTDRQLSANFQQLTNGLLDQHWAAELDEALTDAIARMRSLMRNATDLREVTEAFKALAEVGITREVLSADTEPSASRPATSAPSEASAPNNFN
jgi:hypothetical protein